MNCYDGPVDLGSQPEECGTLSDKIASMTSHLNWYDLYRPLLTYKSSSEADRYGETVINGEVKTYKRGMTMQEYTPWASHLRNDTNAESVVLNDFVTDYMNLAETRKAFNIPDTVQAWQ